MAIFAAFTKLVEASANIGGDVTTTATAKAPYVSEGVALNDNEATFWTVEDIPVSSGAGEFWASWYVKPDVSGNDGVVRFFDTDFDNTNAVITVRGGDGMVSAGVQIWDGSSQVQILADPAGEVNVLIKWDLQFIRDDTVGLVRLYRNNALHAEVTGIDTNRAAWNNINMVEALDDGNSSGGDLLNVSAFILADENTRDMIFAEETFSGVGALDTLSTGSAADVIDDNVATSATMEATGLNLSLLGTISDDFDVGHTVEAVVTSIMVNKTGLAVDDISSLSRIGGVDYTSASKQIETDSPGFQNIQFVEDVSPATAVAWTVAEVEGSEAGFESA